MRGTAAGIAWMARSAARRGDAGVPPHISAHVRRRGRVCTHIGTRARRRECVWTLRLHADGFTSDLEPPFEASPAFFGARVPSGPPPRSGMLPLSMGMLAVGLNQAAQIGKPASPLRGPETARDLHLQAHHAQGLLGLVVGEGGSGVAQEAQAGLPVPAQGQGQVVAAEAALRSGPGRVSGWPPRPPPGAVAGGGFRRTYGDLFGAVDPPGVQFLLGRCRQPLRRYAQGEPFRPRCNRWLGISMTAAAWLLPPSC